MPNPLSLGIFSELSKVRDKRAGRQQAAVEQQQRLEDRLQQQEMRDLQKRTLEEALKPKAPAPVAWKEMETDNGIVQVNPQTGEVRPLNIKAPRKPETPRNIDPLSPEGIGAAVKREQMMPQRQTADDKAVVQVQKEDGSIVYVPRAEAVGQNAPGRAGAGGATKAQRVQALANAKDAVDRFEKSLDLTGSVIMPGAGKSGLQTEYENVQLQMKEMYNLGVLNGPDLALMRRVLSDPTDIKARLLAGGNATEHAKRTKAQVAKVREILQGYEKNLGEGMNAMGGGPAPKAGAPPAVKSDPEFEALMASLRPPRKP